MGWRRGIAGVVAGIVVLCALAVFFSPWLSGLPLHVRAKWTSGALVMRSAPPERLSIARGGATATAAVDRTASTTPRLQLICVRIC